MRPTGEVRVALRNAAQALATEREQGATWRDMAQHACVARQHARRTVINMARAGELRATGSVRVPGACRPMTPYLPATPTKNPEPTAQLDQLMRAWR
jgi:hypothetical protein